MIRNRFSGQSTVAAFEGLEPPECFVVMPFVERNGRPDGFFEEAHAELFVPAIREAGFIPASARGIGSDVIPDTIDAGLSAAMVLADLTDGNPNVFHEVGRRQQAGLPVCLVHAAGTEPVACLATVRTYSYDPKLWRSSLETDRQAIASALRNTWRAWQRAQVSSGLEQPDRLVDEVRADPARLPVLG